MKTLRVSILASIAALAASAAIAGPGIGYWNSIHNSVKDQAPSVAAIAPAKCEQMPVTVGKRTTTVECKGAVADTAVCKAQCGGS